MRASLLLLAGASLIATPAFADTLREALVPAYATNPDLTGQREALKVTDANVAIARAAGRPQVSATVGLNRDLTRSGILDTRRQGPRPLRRGRSQLSAVQRRRGPQQRRAPPSDPGRGRPRDAARGRRRRLHRRRRRLHGRHPRPRDRRIERTIMSGSSTNLEATRDRFEIGDLTRTDVAQSEARLQLGRSPLATAQGRLTAQRGELSPGHRLAPRARLPRRRRCRRFPPAPTKRCGSRSPTTPTCIAVTRQADRRRL